MVSQIGNLPIGNLVNRPATPIVPSASPPLTQNSIFSPMPTTPNATPATIPTLTTNTNLTKPAVTPNQVTQPVQSLGQVPTTTTGTGIANTGAVTPNQTTQPVQASGQAPAANANATAGITNTENVTNAFIQTPSANATVIAGGKTFRLQEIDANFNPTGVDKGTYKDLNGDNMLSIDEITCQDGKGGMLDPNSPEFQAKQAEYAQNEVLTDLDNDGKISADEYVYQDGKGKRTQNQQEFDARAQALQTTNPNLKPTNNIFDANLFPVNGTANQQNPLNQPQTKDQFAEQISQMIQTYLGTPGADQAKAQQLAQQYQQNLKDNDLVGNQAIIAQLAQQLGIPAPAATAPNATATAPNAPSATATADPLAPTQTTVNPFSNTVLNPIANTQTPQADNTLLNKLNSFI